MQYLTPKANEYFIDAYRHRIEVILSKLKKDWPNGSEDFDDVEDWLDFVEDILFRLGITDVQCLSIATPKNSNNSYAFQFFFENELESIQFKMAILQDVRGNFTREVQSNTPEQSSKREQNIRKFLTANEIRSALHRKDDTTFFVTTAWLHNDLAIALHLLKGTFEKAKNQTTQKSRQIPALFRAYEWN